MTMRIEELVRLAKSALPLMTANARAEAEALIADLEPSALSQAAAAFERDMRPTCTAIVSALQAGDMEALRGLRAMLPHLLADVNQDPTLADVLAFQLGKSFLAGLAAKPEDVV
jgi:hypothetical protein